MIFLVFIIIPIIEISIFITIGTNIGILNTIAIILITALSCVQNQNSNKIDDLENKFGIVIHGGAGTILKKNMSDEKEEQYKAKLKEAIHVGYEILNNGGSSLDAVEKSIIVLENSPLFNAGKGAVFSNRKINEMDASIMCGKTLNAGAVSGVTNVKNPISLALALMNQSEHVLSLIHI